MAQSNLYRVIFLWTAISHCKPGDKIPLVIL